MRGFACLLAYFVGVSAVISTGLISVMALQLAIERTPSAPILAATVSHKDRLVAPIKQTIVAYTKARPDQKHKMVRGTRNPMHEAPIIVAGHNYGYAEEPHRIDPHLFSIFDR